MANLLVFVLDNLEQLPDILEAWNEAGVSGTTILESTGQARVRGAMRDDDPLGVARRPRRVDHVGGVGGGRRAAGPLVALLPDSLAIPVE